MRSLLPYISSKPPGGGSPRQFGVKLPGIFACGLMAAVTLGGQWSPRLWIASEANHWASAKNLPRYWTSQLGSFASCGPLWFWSAMLPGKVNNWVEGVV